MCSYLSSTFWLTIGMCVLAWAAPSPLRADRFVLQDGGSVDGTRIESPAETDSVVTIRSESGIEITLPATRLREVVRSSAEQQQYARRAPTYPDSVEGQWALSQWCQQNQLASEREVHLRRILEIDPDHIAARHALGYSEVGGQWVRQEEYLRQRGYRKYRGQWRLPQEIELARRDEEISQARKQWMIQLRRWRAQLASDQGQQVAAAIREIRDPRAVAPLTHYLGQETARPVKLLYLDALHAIGDAAAFQTLISASLNDPDEEVFHECLDRIERSKTPRLAVDPYIKALEDENNVRVNRGAHALGRLGDTRAMAPLITALVTQHQVVVSAGGRGAGETISSTFSRDGRNPAALGGTRFSTGGGTRAWQEMVANPQVLDALIRLSGGVNFGFDRKAWRAWLAQRQQGPNPGNLQRR